jgi:uncharacterized membrane protein
VGEYVVAFSFAQSGIALKSFENPVSQETGFFVAHIPSLRD